MRFGVIAIARPTFDVEFAQQTADAAVASLEAAGHEVAGSGELAMDEESVVAERRELERKDIDGLIVLQASFADSSLAVAATDGATGPVVLWAFPEERTGGRLRLNSFCGINLAAYTLRRKGVSFGWVHAPAADVTAPERVVAAITSAPDPEPRDHTVELDHLPVAAVESARSARARLDRTVVGRVGERPDGFEPCGYEAGALRAILGVRVDEVPLPELFDRSAAADTTEVAAVRDRAAELLVGLDDVDQDALDRSLRYNVGLRSLIDERGWDGVATRCWPETFTEFGGAVCTPMSMLADQGVPGACEADVYGNITGLVLQWLGGSVSFVADLVDLDTTTGTGVLWHCGLAPLEMADPASVPKATIHSNRRKPLLSEFPLKPGRVTIARFSQSRGRHRLVVGTGEMVSSPLPFSGTAGVIAFDSPVADVEQTILDEGLEHHYGMVYAEVADELRALAALLEIPVVAL